MLGLVVLVVVLLVAVQVMLRPAVLTRLANKYAAEYVDGMVSFKQVKAHVIKSFPFLHLEADDLSITYPHSRYERFDTLAQGRSKRLMTAGYQRDSSGTDTLLSLKRLDLALDYMALLKGEIHVHNLELQRPRIFAHYYDSTAANWDILPLKANASKEADDTAPEVKDTAAKASKSLPPIKLNRIALRDRPMIIYTNPVDTLMGMFTMRRLTLDGKIESKQIDKASTALEIDSLFVSGRLPKDTLALALERLRAKVNDRNVELEADAKASLRTGSFGRVRLPIHIFADAYIPQMPEGELGAQINKLQLGVTSINLEGSGEIYKRADGTLDMDLLASINKCPIGELIDQFQENIPALKKLSTNAIIDLDAKAKGQWGNGKTPSIDARLMVPRSTIDYEGLGRKGALALEANVKTDDLKEINANIDKLFVDIFGAKVDARGSIKDILGKDPKIGLNGTVHARVDSLTQAFTREMGIEGTGRIDAKLKADARMSQLDMSKIGNSSVTCNLTARDLSVQIPKDSLSAFLPVLDLELETKGNSIDRNLPKNARVLALKANLDTMDVSVKDMFIRSGPLQLLMQNSADILKRSGKLTSLMGILKVNNLRLKDQDGLALSLRDNRETFRIEPESEARKTPRFTVRSNSGRLRLRTGGNMYSLRDMKFDVSASKHQSRAPRDTSLRRRRVQRRQDDFADKYVKINLGESVRKYVREWDINGNLDLGSGRMFMPSFPLRTSLSDVKGSFCNDTLDLKSINIKSGQSDISAKAKLSGTRRVLLGRGKGHMKLKADVLSNYLEVNELMRAIAYHSTYQPPKDIANASDQEVEAAIAQTQLPDVGKSKLIVIPSNLDIDFTLEANGIKYDSLLVSWAAADVAMRQRTLQITNAVAASNMGDIYFEGFYSTRAKDDISAGFDLNLVHITAEKVITLFPAVDTIMPMLKSFAGDLDCELAATSQIDTMMNLVKPSIDGVLRISGKDLTLRNSAGLEKIAKLLKFNKKDVVEIDRMSVTGIVQDNVIEVFPFVLDVDRYQFAASGLQHLENDFDYHISVIKSPLVLKFGVNIWGPDFGHIHYGLGKAKYKSANVPVYTKQLDTMQYSLVAAIHNIFELGIEKALAETRTDQYVEASAIADAHLTEAEVTDLSALAQSVSQSVSTRREAIKQEVLQLQAQAANEQL